MPVFRNVVKTTLGSVHGPGLDRRALVVLLTLAVLTGCSVQADRPARGAEARAASPAAALQVRSFGAATDTGTASAESVARVEHRSFSSASLKRTMRYVVFVPPGYDSDPARSFPTLYLLHGMGGDENQWLGTGLVDRARQLMSDGAVRRMLIVMPQGDRGYWVDHAAGGEQWGRYAAVDLVREVESEFRTLADRSHRAIGGLSMGAHGALQLALNYPGTFGAVGSHSLVLRRFGSAPAYFGDAAEFAKRDPMTLAPSHVRQLRAMKLWVDIGADDPWVPLARQYHSELEMLGVPHQWHEWAGDHSGKYWGAHAADYLRFYDEALGAADAAAAAAAF